MNTPNNAAALRDIDEACQAGLNSSDPKHWEAALQDIMQSTRATLTSQPSGEAVVYQCMCTDEDDLRNGPRNIWMDVDSESFDKLRQRDDVRSRILYTHPSAGRDGEAVACIQTNVREHVLRLSQELDDRGRYNDADVLKKLITHPAPADAPGVAVDEALRGVCMRMLTFENSEHVPNVMFQQLRAALAPKPEGE